MVSGSTLVLALLGSSRLATAKSLWSSVPATFGATDNDEYILKTGYLLGNGKLGAIPFGPPGQETLVLNLDSLWSGGPFQLTNFTGGNPTEPVYQSLPGIRDWIFQNGTGNVSQLLNAIEGYGSYQTLGNLSVSFDTVSQYTDYTRTLDLTTGVHTSSWTSNGTSFSTSVFCSYPAESCIYSIDSSSPLPPITIALANNLMDPSLVNITSGADFTRLTALTQASIGLKFDAIARVSGNFSTACSSDSAVLTVIPSSNRLTIAFSAESDYDASHGDAGHNFSFKGTDPGPLVEQRTLQAASQSYEVLLQAHQQDYSSLMGTFTLHLPDTANSSTLETAALVSRYTASDPFLESLLFDYARHLLVSSSRVGSLPANLQGRWTEQVEPSWGADYHANINLQMNYWAAEQTGLGELATPLFAYMEKTWAPRGSETAKLLYNGEGWVTHDEMDIFGYTGMKNDAQWANYPASAAWLTQHVFDHYDYTRNTTWLRETGYPLLKAVASFWLSQLQEDRFTNDGTLVVNPCNSPEQGPSTFGCAHYQQLIHQLFSAIIRTAPLLNDSSDSFATALAQLDTGIHIDNTTSTIQEWKVPDSYLYNVYPQHRHLSHLVGWFPGSSTLYRLAPRAAVRASLLARGNGTDTDGDGGNYGWAKVWRGACWARLGDAERAYAGLQLSVVNNIAGNLLSMYVGGATNSPPFQIDMNFGWAGNVLSMLVIDVPEEQTVVLGPAIPAAWGDGSVEGLRVRGGLVVDFQWDGEGVVTSKTVVSGDDSGVRVVNSQGTEL